MRPSLLSTSRVLATALSVLVAFCCSSSQGVVVAAAVVRVQGAVSAGATFNEELREPKYVVALSQGPAPPLAERGLDQPRQREVVMRDVNGSAYTCYIPVPNPAAEGEAGAASALLPQKGPEELLEGLAGRCFYRVEDWWTYEVCYKAAVRQYHKEGAQLVSQYSLGRYSKEASGAAGEVQVDSTEVGGELRYVAHRFTEGEKCELTGEPRQAEVRYTCHPGGSIILSIKEPASCSYVITVGTQRLCKHPAFREPERPAAVIACYAADQPDASGGTGGAGGGGECSAAHAVAAAAGHAEQQEVCSAGGSGDQAAEAEAQGDGAAADEAEEEEKGGEGSSAAASSEQEGEAEQDVVAAAAGTANSTQRELDEYGEDEYLDSYDR